jgi:hypothetical protein
VRASHHRPRIKGFRSVPIELPNLQGALREAGLPAIRPRAKRVEYDIHASNDSLRTNLVVSLGKLSPQQYAVARKVYADGWKQGLCRLKQKRGRVFLNDLLTPAMQANNGVVFNEQRVEKTRPLTAQEERTFRVRGGAYVAEKVLDTNCWSTSLEVNRRAGGQNPVFTVHNFNSDEVERVLRSDSRSRSRTGAFVDAGGLKRWLSRWGTKFGDYVIARGDVPCEGGTVKQMLHVASFVDDGLLFERVGNGLPGRVGRLDDMLALYPNARFEVRRLSRDMPHVSGTTLKRAHPPQMSEGVVYQTEILTRDLAMARNRRGRHNLVGD